MTRARMTAIVVTACALLAGLALATFTAWGIAFMAEPPERAVALETRDYSTVHGPLERIGGTWRLEGVDAAAMPADAKALRELVGEEVIGLVHGGELVALDLPEGERVVHGRSGWAPVWVMAALVLPALLAAVLSLGAVAGRLSRRLPLWARGAVATAPFVLAGVVIGHLRSGEMVKVDVVVVAPLVLLVLVGVALGPRWWAATETLAHQEL